MDKMDRMYQLYSGDYNKKTHLLRAIGIKFSYERIVTNHMKPYFKGCNGFMDLGASIGYYTMLAHKNGVKNIYSFEPDKERFNELRKRFEMFDNVKVYPFATSNVDKELKFYYNKNSDVGTGSLFAPSKDRKKNRKGIDFDIDSFTVNAKPIDSVVTDEVNLVKMDVEGAEFDTLMGMQKMINRCHPVIFCEVHLVPQMVDNNIDPRDMYNFVVNNSYRVYKIEPLDGIDYYMSFLGNVKPKLVSNFENGQYIFK